MTDFFEAMEAKDYPIMTGVTEWESPSNIALVKYWGKAAHQIPKNPSVSFTLQKSVTTTKIEWVEKSTTADFVTFYFEGKRNVGFGQRIEKLIRLMADQNSILYQYSYKIYSSNTFPHSSGIASSASAMSALAMGIVDMMRQISIAQGQTPKSEEYYQKQASYYSRLGSGSACRSIYANAALWGEVSPDLGSDLWAVSLNDRLHDQFRNYQDAIIIVDESPKSVSSSQGHALMNDHLYRDIRFDTARKNTDRILDILSAGNCEDFVEIVEAEALQLHALMMTSQPSFILLKPHTLSIIEKVREFRASSKIPLCFTLDAGPNVHILYPAEYSVQVVDFIASEIVPLSSNGRWIQDEMGSGSKNIQV